MTVSEKFRKNKPKEDEYFNVSQDSMRLAYENLREINPEELTNPRLAETNENEIKKYQ